MSKIRFQIYLNEYQLNKLKEMKEKNGAPISEIIRRIINTHMEDYPTLWDKDYEHNDGIKMLF